MSSFDPRAWLDGHVNLERGVGVPADRPRGAPTLERVSTLLKFLGSPEHEFPSVHVTGTNGKTSTARMITQLFVAMGLKVGAYTSPHLERVNERISLDGEPIDDHSLDEALYAVELVERSTDVQPSYFEILTAAAFRYFEDEAVDVAVVEVGLGGTWDATNVVDGRVAVVTNVGIDHVEFLGPTREAIAAEKSGIVKPESILVLGETDPDLESFFTDHGPRRVMRRDVDFGVRANDPAVGGRLVDIYTDDAAYPSLYVPLHGAVQADNAALALAAAEAFVGAPLPPDVVADAFREVRSPGRLEVVGHQPLVVIDGTKNVIGADVVRRTIDEEFAPAPRTLVVGLLREKDPREMLTALGVAEAAHVVCCPPDSPRALDPTVLAATAQELGVPLERIDVSESVAAAVGAALLVTPDDGQIVIAGSLYVAGPARALFIH